MSVYRDFKGKLIQVRKRLFNKNVVTLVIRNDLRTIKAYYGKAGADLLIIGNYYIIGHKRKKLINIRPEEKGMRHFHIGHEEIESNENNSFGIIEPVWWPVSIYDGKETYDKDLKAFSIPQRHVFAIQWYISEVNNGGHDQFYFNPTGIVWKDALEGFRAIGHKKCENILTESIKLLGYEIPFDHEERQNILDDKNPDFSDLDSEFYKIDDLENAIMSYIKKNEVDFYFDGDIEHECF